MLGLHVVSRAATTYYKSLYSMAKKVFLFSPLMAINVSLYILFSETYLNR